MKNCDCPSFFDVFCMFTRGYPPIFPIGPKEMAIGIPWDMQGNGISIILIIPIPMVLETAKGIAHFLRQTATWIHVLPGY